MSGIERKFHFHNPLHHEGRQIDEHWGAKSILVVINDGANLEDPNDPNRRALDLALAMAHLYHGSGLSIVKVVERSHAIPPEDEMEEQKEEAWKILSPIEGIANRNNILNVRTAVLTSGSSVQAIIDEADDIGADYIIVGTTGKNKFGQFEVGHFQEGILNHEKSQQVILVSTAKTATTSLNSPYQSVPSSV